MLRYVANLVTPTPRAQAASPPPGDRPTIDPPGKSDIVDLNPVVDPPGKEGAGISQIPA